MKLSHVRLFSFIKDSINAVKKLLIRNLKADNYTFHLFSFSSNNAEGLTVPEGSLIIQALGFPKDTEFNTWIPTKGVNYYSKISVYDLDNQWYYPLKPITDDFKAQVKETKRVGQYLCHAKRPDSQSYPISILKVNSEIIHELGFEESKIYFSRLGHTVIIDLSDIPEIQRFTLSAEWSPFHIELRVSWAEGTDLHKYYSGEGVEYEDFEDYTHPKKGNAITLKNRLEFNFTSISLSLLEQIWSVHASLAEENDAKSLRRNDIETFRKFYNDKDDFFKTFIIIIQEIHRILEKIKPTAFWNDKVPKSEPDAGSSLRGYFEALCPQKNIKINQEVSSRSGDVDFTFSAILKNVEHIELILELKNAHSSNLESGLKFQLPQYIKEQSCDFAVYGVFWFKGRHFNEPKKYTEMINCLQDLEKIRPESVSFITGFDVSFRIPATKLK